MKRWLILAALAVSGCVSSHHAMLSPTHYDPVDPEAVSVFMDASEVGRPYEKLAILDASAAYTNDDTRLVTQLRAHAAKLGANGVILGAHREAGTGEKVAQAFLLGVAEDNREAIAIRY